MKNKIFVLYVVFIFILFNVIFSSCGKKRNPTEIIISTDTVIITATEIFSNTSTEILTDTHTKTYTYTTTPSLTFTKEQTNTYSNTFTMTQTYTVTNTNTYINTPTITNTPADTYEPDNNYTEATTLINGVQQEHSGLPFNDEDWFIFKLTDCANVTITTTGPTGDTHMWLYNSVGVPTTHLIYNDDGGPDAGIGFSQIQQFLSPGTYYVKIWAYNTQINKYFIQLNVINNPCTPTITTTFTKTETLTYTLTPTLTTTPTVTQTHNFIDQYEPDNVYMSANTITHSEHQVHSIIPANDEDWVTFTITEQSTITLTGANYIYLYDSAGVPSTHIAYANRVLKAVLAPGTYYAKSWSNAEITQYTQRMY